MHRVFFIVALGLSLSTSAFSRPPRGGGFFRPHFFSPETESLLFDAPSYLHFQELAFKLNRLAAELRREAFQESRRQQYQRALDQLAEARDELVAFMRGQSMAASEISKLEQANVESIDTGTLADDGSAASSDESTYSVGGASSSPRTENTTLQTSVANRPTVSRGRLPDRIPGATSPGAASTDNRDGKYSSDLPPRFRGDPRETMAKFGAFFSAGPETTTATRGISSRAVEHLQSAAGEADSATPVPGGREARDALIHDVSHLVVEPSVDSEDGLTADRPALAMSSADAGYFPLRAINHLVDGSFSIEHGGPTMLIILLALACAVPVLMRRRAAAAGIGAPQAIDLSAMHGATNAETPQPPRLPRGSTFAVVWDTRMHCWTLTQKLDHNPISRVVAELREGTVVYGNLLGRSAADRYRLNDIDEWIPTQEPERLVLDLREGMRFGGGRFS